jgi:protein-S-isoprenylcysteine O-methyltransferase Ste14
MDQTTTYPKVMPPMGMLGGILLMLILHFVFPIIQIVPTFWKLLGFLPLMLGLALSFAAERQFRQVGTTVHPSGETSQLVTDGYYRYSRNPMYLGMGLTLLGVALLLGSLMPFGVIALFTWWIKTQFIRREEDMLATQFGNDWLEYKARVRRWI